MFENGDLILRYLERLGVHCVFGVPGGSIEPFYNALARSQRRGGIRAITARHETGAALMAEGYARETGTLGVCCATAGPGATNLITGVASAYADGIPMLVITAQTSLEKFGQGSLQETSCTGINTVEMFARCTRYNTLVSHSAQLEPKLLQAISQSFSNTPGPVHLSIPIDVMRLPVPESLDTGNLRAFTNHSVAPSQTCLQALLKEVAETDRVTVVIGEGAASALSELMALIEARHWKFVATPRAKGLVDHFHPLFRGIFGFAGHESAAEALKVNQAERVIAVGTGLDEVSTAGWDPTAILSDRLIHLSPNPEHLTRSNMARLVILGSPELMLKPFAEMLANDPQRTPSVAHIDDDGLPADVSYDDRGKCDMQPGTIKPQALVTHLARSCPAGTRVALDSGTSFLWGIHYWNVSRPHNLPAAACLVHLGIGFATMGWAVGASVGIAAANPEQPVVCVTGDGSYLMAGQEITTALQENLNLLMIVLNDSSLGMVRHGQSLSGGESIAHDLPDINYARIAEAMGIESYRVESTEQLLALDLMAIFTRPGPCLLDIRIDRDELPPMGSRMKVLTGATP